MVRHAAQEYGVHALGVTLSREQASWAQERIKEEGLDRPRRGAAPRLPARRGDRVRRGLLDRADRAHRGEELPGVLRVHPRQAAPAGPAAQPLHHPARQPPDRDRGVPGPLRLPRRRADRLGPDHHRGAERRPRGAARGEHPRPLRADAGRLVPQPGARTGTRASPRSARAPPGCGASTWPAPASPSSATRSSCTTCSPPRPTRRGQRVPAAPHRV